MKIDISKFHKRAIEIAQRESLLEKKKQCTIAFVLNSRGRVMKEGWNSLERTHPLQAESGILAGNKNKIYLHAETHAISRVRYPDLPNMRGIVVIRLNRSLELMYAAPCECCSKLIEKYSIETIVHS